MKYLVATLSFLFLSVSAYSQTREYKDLIILYADGTLKSYEKLVKEAEKYTLKDGTKKDPKPYFWMAKGLYKISISGTDDENYKNAYKDAIKYLGKGIKYDLKYNDGNYMKEESEFVEKMQLTLFETANNEIIDGGYKRGFSWVLKYNKITTNTVGANYLMGACKYESQDKTSARDYWRKADEELAKIESIENWSEADKKMLKYGVLHSAGSLKRSRQEDKAKELVNKVAQWFENDEDWETLYDEIVNKPME